MKSLTQWFDREVRPVWENELVPLCRNWQPQLYLEIGVCEGHSMRWMLENVRPVKAIGVDPYVAPKRRGQRQKTYDTYQQNARESLAPWLESGQLQLMIAPSRNILRMMTFHDESCDLIYVDGDHNAYAAITDMVLAWWKLQVGGILILDDYNRRWHLGKPWSHEAINAFLMAFEKRYDLLWGAPYDNKTRQIAVRKLKPDA